MKIKKALISVSDKSDLEPLVCALNEKGVEIVSSGGTRKEIESYGIKVTPIEKVTGNPEAFGGRMKTLSFQVGSALLFQRNLESDNKEAKELGIEAIDLVICNLYPFEDVLKRGGEFRELIENIDIGGPTMIRASAKNFESVCVLTNKSQYGAFLDTFNKKGETDYQQRKDWAKEAFELTAKYDELISKNLFEDEEKNEISIDLKSARLLRYGENPHQKGQVVSEMGVKGGLAKACPLQGKELSYNNLLDSDAALRANSDFSKIKKSDDLTSVTIIKHGNPCGAAIAKTPSLALELAWSGDPVSSFGSVIACDSIVDEEFSSWLSDKFVEIIIAPEFTESALKTFSKKKNLRLLKMDNWDSERELMIRSISGGYLVQEEDSLFDREFQVMTENKLDSSLLDLASFGTMVGKHLKSNAIALVAEKEGSWYLQGAGMGNPNRLISLKQAAEKASDNGVDDLSSSLLISDAFFPFKDNIEMAHEYGISWIVQPGGSIKDQEVIDCCNKLKIGMAFTGRRHFRH